MPWWAYTIWLAAFSVPLYLLWRRTRRTPGQHMKTEKARH
jgi:hypothetical protein